MEQTEFLEQQIFKGFKNLNDGFDLETIHYFSESDFAIVLQRVEHFGISIYEMKPWFNGKFCDISVHGDFNKKATDPRWYKSAFLAFKKNQARLFYSATYKVSKKLLARQDSES